MIKNRLLEFGRNDLPGVTAIMQSFASPEAGCGSKVCNNSFFSRSVSANSSNLP